MRIADIMTSDVETVAPTDTAEDALAKMNAAHIHHLVVTQGRRILGVLSARDLGRPQDRANRRERTVGELMSPDPVLADPDMPVRRAANILRGRTIGSLPVVEKGKLVGIVTISDLLELVGRTVVGSSSTGREQARRRPRAVAAR